MLRNNSFVSTTATAFSSPPPPFLFWSRHPSSVPVVSHLGTCHHRVATGSSRFTADMSLPYELLDEIFSYLPPHDRESLRAYSLVAKSWVAPAQSRLFSSVIITEDNYQSWKDSVSPANKELLSNVRSLWYLTLLRIPSWNTPPIDDFFGYLSSFHRLQRLFLCSTSIKPGISKRLQVFSAFRHSLSSLILHTLILTWSSFVALVDYFPYVRDLEVSHPIWGIDYEQAPPLSRPLRGRLSINVCQHLALKIFTDRFSGLEVEYDELLILGEDGARSSARHYQRVIDTCGNSLKRLRLGLPACTFRYIQIFVVSVS